MGLPFSSVGASRPGVQRALEVGQAERAPSSTIRCRPAVIDDADLPGEQLGEKILPSGPNATFVPPSRPVASFVALPLRGLTETTLPRAPRLGSSGPPGSRLTIGGRCRRPRRRSAPPRSCRPRRRRSGQPQPGRGLGGDHGRLPRQHGDDRDPAVLVDLEQVVAARVGDHPGVMGQRGHRVRVGVDLDLGSWRRRAARMPSSGTRSGCRCRTGSTCPGCGSARRSRGRPSGSCRSSA